MRGEVVLRVVYKNKRYPQGAFEAYCYYDGSSKSKQCALHVHDVDIAFETVDLWAEDKAKETGYPYKKKTKDQLLAMIEWGANRTGEQKPPTEPLRSNLGNRKYFKAEIKRVFAELGYERVSGALKEGRTYLDSLERERNDAQRKTDKAKLTVAQALFNTYLESGIDTSAYCNDEEIVAKFNELRAKNEKLI